jgi:uncharacterized protein DUF481
VINNNILKGTGGIMPPVLLYILILLVPQTADAVIVNSLRGFAESHPGWSGGLGGSFGASGGNTEQSTLSADARLQWQSDRETWRIMGKAKRTTSAEIVTARAVLGHLRHNHRLNDHLQTLAFVQLQENPFQHLKSRFLAGAGLRWTVHPGFAVGLSNMLEREDIQDQADVVTHQRMSCFVSMVHDLREGVRLDILAFYQPLWSDFNDWRSFVNLGLDVDLTENLGLFTGLDLERNSHPPTGVEKTDWETATGFRIRF